METKPFLSGEQVTLRPLEEKDLAGPYVSWLNDPEVCEHNSHHVFPYSLAEAKHECELAESRVQFWIRSKLNFAKQEVESKAIA